MYHLGRSGAAVAAIIALASCDTSPIDGPGESTVRGSSPMAPSFLLEELTAEEQAMLDEANLAAEKLESGGQAVVGTGRLSFEGVEDRVTIAAFRHQDGSFSGHYILRTRVVELDRVTTIRGDVVCLFIAENRALVLGTGEDPTSLPVPGLVDYQTIDITDNGSGGDALPDQFEHGGGSALPEVITPTSCTNAFGGGLPAMQGNFVIKG